MKRRPRFFLGMACVVLLGIFGMTGAFGDDASDQEREKDYMKVRKYVSKHRAGRCVLAPEGEFITVFHPTVAGWVTETLDRRLIGEIQERLAPALDIQLTPRGFARAADPSAGGAAGEIGYDAVWVRDAAWVYFALREEPRRRADARKLLIALWDYYATKQQVGRFDDIISHPEHAADKMKVPHIRFNGNSPSLADVYIDGKPQAWNHRQNDAHGIFLIALADAVTVGLVTADDLTPGRFAPLVRFPAYFDAIGFDTFEDAGAWEEIDRRNTSSIGLVTRSLQLWKVLVVSGDTGGEAGAFRERFHAYLRDAVDPLRGSWREDRLEALIERGVKRVKRQLALGGESPDYDPCDVRFRRADAYLVTLIVPSPLEGLAEGDLRQVLAIIETLKRPAGTIRYVNDSYQSGNYWIKPQKKAGKKAGVTETGDASSQDLFLARFKDFMPGTEAQWFFDSLLVLARLHLAAVTEDPVRKKEDLYLAAIHLKRALGQLTGTGAGGEPLIAADGRAVPPLLPPESINTVEINGRRYLLPSPIVPLNWAKAALSMALSRYEKAIP
ncbi:MAG: hypothetical protein JXO48_04590 [Deltaproteobacteria bacterium]|nr:hypothetical protein [Deltaproteobacteria bacterium]